MLKNVLILIIFLISTGCGGGSSSSKQAENNNIVFPQTENPIVSQLEPYYYQQWYLHYNQNFYMQNDIDKNANIHSGDYLKKYGGRGIKIAVIDNGLDVSHEDLVDAVMYTFDIATHSTNVSHTKENAFHGTAVTGIIGARVNKKGIRGIACNADIIFLKDKEYMSESEIIELFNKAEEWGQIL